MSLDSEKATFDSAYMPSTLHRRIHRHGRLRCNSLSVGGWSFSYFDRATLFIAHKQKYAKPQHCHYLQTSFLFQKTPFLLLVNLQW
jgi:hypothetical protein